MDATQSTADRLSGAGMACRAAGGDTVSVAEFVDVLKAPLKILKGGREWQSECEGLLKQAVSLLDPSVPSGKELMDYVGGELPIVVVHYIGVSKDCHESSTRLIQGLAASFDPAREMFTAFFEVINIFSKPHTLHLCLPLLRGLCIVFPRIRRRTTDFFKEAVPGLIDVGRSAGQEVDYLSDPDEINDDSFYPDRLLLPRDYKEDNFQQRVIDELIHLAKVIKGICDNCQAMQKLRDILGTFSLQLLSLACGAVSESSTALSDEVLELINLLSFSNVSLSILVSVAEVDKIIDVVTEGDELQAQKSRLEAKQGAALAVYWGIQREEADDTSKELAALKQHLQTARRQMVLDIISLASTLLIHLSCTQEISLKIKGLCLMTYILEVYCASSDNDNASQLDDELELSFQIRPALQRLQDVIVYVQSPMLRRQAYGILIKIITQVLPTQASFATLSDLISTCGHPSLVSLLVTCVKDEVLKAWPGNEGGQKVGQDAGSAVTSSVSPFISPQVQEFIQIVLRTKTGELAELPLNWDAVIAALNLYRFLLIRESSGHTNYTHVLSPAELEKGRTYWLMPLLDQILKVQSVVEAADHDAGQDIQVGMDSLKSVLFRCLELVELLLAKLQK